MAAVKPGAKSSGKKPAAPVPALASASASTSSSGSKGSTVGKATAAAPAKSTAAGSSAKATKAAKAVPAAAAPTAGSKAAKAKSVVPGAAPVPAVPDPWAVLKSPFGGRLSPNDEWKLKPPAVTLSRDDLLGCKPAGSTSVDPATVQGLLNAKRSADSKSEDGSSPTVDTVSCCVAAPDCDLASLHCFAACTGVIVGIDVSGNQLDERIIADVSLKWLRHLCIAGNLLTRLPPLDPFPMLLSLDISFNNIGSLNAAIFAPVASRLRSLNVAGCGISSLRHDSQYVLAALESLESLNLNHNNLTALEDLAALSVHKRLVHLWTLNNPWTLIESFGDALQATRLKLSCLQSLNGGAPTAAFKANATPTDMLADSMTRVSISDSDSASCSCIEGNPCAVPYNCRNWEKRFEVARKAREEKYDRIF